MKKAKSKIEKIKEVLMNSEVTFAIKGTSAIWEDCFAGRGMNVSKFGPTCVTLYTFDMFSSKTTAKIRYEDVELISTVKK